MRSLLLVGAVMMLPGLAVGQTCTASAGSFGSANAPVTANICSFSHQLAQDCAGTPFGSSTVQQAIYAVNLSATSNAVIQLQAGSAFTPYLALFAQGAQCSGSTSCGTYENIGASAGSAISIPSTSGLAAGTYDLIVSDVTATGAIPCATPPDTTSQFTLSITSGNTPVQLQKFSVN